MLLSKKQREALETIGNLGDVSPSPRWRRGLGIHGRTLSALVNRKLVEGAYVTGRYVYVLTTAGRTALEAGLWCDACRNRPAIVGVGWCQRCATRDARARDRE